MIGFLSKIMRLKTGLRAAAVLVMAAVFAQAFVPAGYMPSFDEDGRVAIIICSGAGEKTVLVDDAFGHASDDDTSPEKSACPYFLTQTFSAPPALTYAALLNADAEHFLIPPAYPSPEQFSSVHPPARAPPVLRLS